MLEGWGTFDLRQQVGGEAFEEVFDGEGGCHSLRAARANQQSYNQSNKLACSVKEVKREKNKKQTNLLVCFWLECKLPLVSILTSKWLRDGHCNG